MSKARATSRLRKFLLCVALPVVLAAGVFALTWDSGYCSIRDRFFPRRFVAVIPDHLFRSGWIDRHLVEDVLRDHRIELVVDLTGDDVPSAERDAEQLAVRHLGIEYRRFPLRGDGTGDVVEYADAVAAIANAQAQRLPVLVHCAAGDKRSGGVVAAYLLLVRGASVAEAKEEIGRFSKRGIPSDTVLRYLDDHLAEIAERVKVDGCVLAPGSTPAPVLGF